MTALLWQMLLAPHRIEPSPCRALKCQASALPTGCVAMLLFLGGCCANLGFTLLSLKLQPAKQAKG